MEAEWVEALLSEQALEADGELALGDGERVTFKKMDHEQKV